MDGDALVVGTGFNGKTWLDQTGKPTSDAPRHRTFSADGLRAHGNSNYNRRPDGLYQVVASQGPVRLMRYSDIFESACENNRDLEHLRGKFSR
jgi:hypothetical protein